MPRRGQAVGSKYEGMFVIGQRWGQWTVIAPGLIRVVGKETYVHVECSCGRTAMRTCCTLVNGRSVRCYRCNRRTGAENHTWRGVGAIPGRYLSRVKRTAAQRGISYTVSPRYLADLYASQEGRCALSGLPITFSDGTASLDRIDNTLGYAPENVQWLHKDVNMMKKDHTQLRFVDLCRAVAARCAR